MTQFTQHFEEDDPRIRRFAASRRISITHAKQQLRQETPINAQKLLAERPFPMLIEKLEALEVRAHENSVLKSLIQVLKTDLDDGILHTSGEELAEYRKNASAG